LHFLVHRLVRSSLLGRGAVLCRAASKTEYESAERGFLLQTSVGAYPTTGHGWACEEAGITVTLPKPMTSNAKAEGRFGKQDFRDVADEDI
jgi:hypothetical protein